MGIRRIEIRVPYFSGGYRTLLCEGDEEWIRDHFVGGVAMTLDGGANAHPVERIIDMDDCVVVELGEHMSPEERDANGWHLKA